MKWGRRSSVGATLALPLAGRFTWCWLNLVACHLPALRQLYLPALLAMVQTTSLVFLTMASLDRGEYHIGWQGVKFRGSDRTTKSPSLQPTVARRRGHPRRYFQFKNYSNSVFFKFVTENFTINLDVIKLYSSVAKMWDFDVLPRHFTPKAPSDGILWQRDVIVWLDILFWYLINVQRASEEKYSLWTDRLLRVRFWSVIYIYSTSAQCTGDEKYSPWTDVLFEVWFEIVWFDIFLKRQCARDDMWTVHGLTKLLRVRFGVLFLDGFQQARSAQVMREAQSLDWRSSYEFDLMSKDVEDDNREWKRMEERWKKMWWGGGGGAWGGRGCKKEEFVGWEVRGFK